MYDVCARDLVLEFLGSNNLDKTDVGKLLSNAQKIMDSKKLERTERSTYVYHLRTAQYLIDVGLWREAAYPILLWSSAVLQELRRRDGEAEKRESWLVMLETLGWLKWNEIKDKYDVGNKIVKLSLDVLSNTFH